MSVFFHRKSVTIFVSRNTDNDVNGVTNKLLSRNSNYIADVVMRPKFDDCSISMREVITTIS